jgi:hypothetical protein
VIRVKIRGEKAIARGVRRAGLKLAAGLAPIERTITVRAVTQGRARLTGLGGVGAHVAPHLRARGGRIVLDHPAGPGAEFGGGARPGTRQFNPYRGHTGYALIPTLRDLNLEVDREIKTLIERSL